MWGLGSKWSWLLLALVCSPLACVVKTERHYYGRDDAGGEPSGAAEGPPGATGNGQLPPGDGGVPVTVEIDTGKSMDAAPGEGVGLFVEYHSGGHWRLWWTCDTLVSGQSCDFAVRAEVEHGPLTAFKTTGLGGGDTAEQTDDNTVVVQSTVTDTLATAEFDTSPGETIALEAIVSGLRDGSYFFFVQDGQINGGFSGTLTNPILVRGKTP